MSADLLAEFGRGSSSAQSSGTRPQTTRPQADSLISGFDQTNDDSFGAASSKSPSNQLLSNPWAQPNNHNATRVPQQQPLGFQTFDLPRQQDSDVLFDATVDTPASEEEDEWGEFEGPEATAQQSQPQPQQTEPMIPQAGVSAVQLQPPPQTPAVTSSFDLLSLDDTAPTPTQTPTQTPRQGQGSAHQASTSNPPLEQTWNDESFDDWGEFTDGQPQATAPAKAPAKVAKAAPKKLQQPVKPAPPQPMWEDDSFEAWDDFTDGPRPAPAPAPAPSKPKSQPKPTSPASTSTSTPPTRNFISPAPTTSPTVRPTNIPPPSVLLDLLVTLLNALQKEALTAKRTTPPSSPEPASKIHNTLTTAAHIIAGRHHRWKRDTILAQAMRIGPATGKTGGMKLSAVNKHEDVKEEQDAVDVVALWRERAALFNGLIQGAGLRVIPPVADPGALKVVIARPEQGALKAGHACALCALRRDERVLRVDEGVEDSFGEWWTEHWGHTGCRVFWERNKGLLGQR